MCANNIKALRVASRKTQAQVAHDLGVKLDRYRSWEQGKRNPTGAMGIKIAEYFGVTTDTVFGSQFAEPIHDNLVYPSLSGGFNTSHTLRYTFHVSHHWHVSRR